MDEVFDDEEVERLLAPSESGAGDELQIRNEIDFSDLEEEETVRVNKSPTPKKRGRKPRVWKKPHQNNVVVQPTALPNMSLFQEVDYSVRLGPFQTSAAIFDQRPKFIVNNPVDPSDLRHKINSRSSSQNSSRSQSSVAQPLVPPSTEPCPSQGQPLLGSRPEIFFRGAENEICREELNTIRKEVRWEVSTNAHTENVKLEENEEDDDEIEVIGVVTNQNKTFKVVKKEDAAKAKVKDHGFPINATSVSLSDRIADYYKNTYNEIFSKDPSAAQMFLKGNINLPKFKNLKRIAADQDKSKDGPASKKTFFESSLVQVEISNLPQDWIDEGVEKISNIAEAYGDGGESVVKSVVKNEDAFIVVFKKSTYAKKFYESLNGRQLDDNFIKVSCPHAMK